MAGPLGAPARRERAPGTPLSTPPRRERAPGTPLSTPPRTERAPGTPLGPLVRRLFTGAAIMWAVLLPLAPFAASQPYRSTLVWSIAVALYGVGSVICHQLPARSFHLWSAQLPVCARCTGIYLGAALAAAVLACGGDALSSRQSTGGAVNNARLVLLLCALPTAATILFEWATGVTPSNAIRALSGLPLGAAAAWAVIRVN